MSEKRCTCTLARKGREHATDCPKRGEAVTWKDKIDADTRYLRTLGKL